MEMIVKVVSLVLVCIVVIAPHAEAAISCNQVVAGVSQCINYVRNGGAIPVSCCNGIKALNKAAQTTSDRQTACTCLKTLAGAIRGVNLSSVAGLPGKCGVNIPYQISPSTDCSKVK